MKNVITLLLFLSSLFFLNPLQAQTQMIGGRLGSPISLSYKIFTNENTAFEFTAGTKGYRNRYYGSYSYRWYSASAAYLVHKPLSNNINGLENLRWYFGGGASAYFWTWKYDDFYDEDRYSSTSFGIQGYLGLEYNFENKPINITLDWVPTIFINGFSSGFRAGFGSVGVRYILNR